MINLVYLPMAFAGGMWAPVEYLPATVQAIAPFLPTYHYVQLALGGIGAGAGDVAVHLLVLATVTAACLAGAAVFYSRQP